MQAGPRRVVPRRSDGPSRLARMPHKPCNGTSSAPTRGLDEAPAVGRSSLPRGGPSRRRCSAWPGATASAAATLDGLGLPNLWRPGNAVALDALRPYVLALPQSRDYGHSAGVVGNDEPCRRSVARSQLPVRPGRRDNAASVESDECRCRFDSQADLVDWVNAVVPDGQSLPHRVSGGERPEKPGATLVAISLVLPAHCPMSLDGPVDTGARADDRGHPDGQRSPRSHQFTIRRRAKVAA
jgi:hypothetical protein